MLTGTHLLQSCGIVLCEIETAEHQEQLFAINFSHFNTLNIPPTSYHTQFYFFQTFKSVSHLHLLHFSTFLFLTSSPVTFSYLSIFSVFVPSFLVCFSVYTILSLLASIRPAGLHIQVWQVMSIGVAVPPRGSSILPFPSRRHTKQQWQALSLSANQNEDLICLISYLII